MPPKQKQTNEAQAIAAVDDALAQLPDEEARTRVLSWAVSKYGGGLQRGMLGQRGGSFGATTPGLQLHENDAPEGLGSRAKAWIKKHGLTPQALDSAFHIDGDTSTLILKTVRGDSKRERVRSVAALLGAMALVRTDNAKFSPSEFREALKQYEAYDPANNTTYVKVHKDVIQGSASAGYTVTSVGLDLAASLLMPAASNPTE